MLEYLSGDRAAKWRAVSRGASTSLAFVLLLAGCGNDTTGNGNPDAAQQTDAAVQVDAGSQTDGGDQQDAALTDAETTQDGGTPSDGGIPSDSGTTPDGAVGQDGGPADDGGTGGMTVSWSSGTFWANCMPMVPPDPWHGDFDLLYDNTAGAAPQSATIQSARVIFQSAGSPALDITVTPTSVGPVAAGASTTQTHAKTGSTNDIPNDCQLCGDLVIFEINLSVGGQSVVLTSPPLTASCAY